ncbi:Rrf2 family transcriptional regulator [Kitasatospora sp. NBC_00240]|uniref:RrF2 family transcriptional regulator n=1 Tax=Kitasatospora sp. NBC_00240 TaxID=2903567 RepID=UPI002250C19E|nr:Rrf2 family transcriptional regulator [Kitasatospora sp. NBC_00240]MCX5207853.1 Rrf2 family transcriptional regulator [Kitasatospora sp. NBC_00240]
MHISAKADYAARALVELARDTARPLTCESIASSQEIPFRFLKSVVGDLRRAGLVRSQRGCEGGYWLGRPAEEISLLDVMRAVDGGLMTLRGEPLDQLDYPAPAQGLPDVWRAVEDSAAAILGRVTVSALVGAPSGGSAPGPAQPGTPSVRQRADVLV